MLQREGSTYILHGLKVHRKLDETVVVWHNLGIDWLSEMK